MKIKAKEIINSFGDIMFARYINLAMFMRSYRHSRGFAIISFLRKITINGENQMKNTDILDKRGENGNNPSAHDVSLYLRCSSKKHDLIHGFYMTNSNIVFKVQYFSNDQHQG